MRCPKCAKENPDIRLFCMSCGELMPEEEPEAEDVKEEEAAARDITAESLTEEMCEESSDTSDELPEAFDVSEDDTEFYRVRSKARRVIEEAWPEEINRPTSVRKTSLFDNDKDFEEPEQEESEYSRNDYRDNRQKPTLDRRNIPELGTPSTIIPKREEKLEPDDFFSVKGQVLPEYDDEDDDWNDENEFHSRSVVKRKEPKQSFIIRHMRGVVTLLLLVITAVIVIIWANTDSAQLMLAGIDLAWTPESYAQLADEAYAKKDLSAAGHYYSLAYEHDMGNYNYAVMAANSYIEGGYNSKALEAVRICIELKPADANLYLMLLQLQPDPENIPSGDRELLKQGYRLTGDSRLNIE